VDNFYVCPRCAAADALNDQMESRLDAADRETLAAWDVDRGGLSAAADALAAALKEVEWDEGGHCLWCYGWERTGGHSLDCQRQEALREYQEVSK